MITVSPQRPGTSFLTSHDPNREGTEVHRSVRWVKATRVGVARRTQAGAWSVAWFDPPKSDLRAQPGLFSPGEWEGDLAHADAREPLTRQQMKQLWVEEEEAR